MDGSDVPQGQNVPGGGGVVKMRKGIHDFETFKLTRIGPQTTILGLESAQSDGRYLRVDGPNKTVNVQGVLAEYERLQVIVVK